MTDAQRIKAYFANLQTKRPQLSGTVAGVEYDATTGRQSRITVTAGGATLLVPLSETAPNLAASDLVQLEQIGTAANAQYRIVDAYGARPNAGLMQFYGDSTVGGNPVGQGDVLLGGAGATDPNFFYDFSVGIWQARTGATVNGSWASDGTIISGATSGPNVQITSTAVNIRQAAVNAINLTAADGIRMYSITGGVGTQKVWIKPDGSGWLAGSDKIAWDTSGNVTLSGGITAAGLNVGTAGNIRGGQTAYDTGTGFWIGYVTGDSKYKFSIGTSTKGMLWDGDDLRVKGAIISSVGSGTEPAMQAWFTSCVFSTTDADTVAWAGGDLTLSADGATYSITGSNTGNMAAKTYIYWDKAVSTTAFQTTTTIGTAFGSGKVLVAVANPGTTAATYQVYGGGASKISGTDIDEASIPSNRLVKTTNSYVALNIDTSDDALELMNHASGKVGFFTAGPVTQRNHIPEGSSGWPTMTVNQWDWADPAHDPLAMVTRINEYDDAITAILTALESYGLLKTS